MKLTAGKQKAWVAAIGTFVSTLILQIATGQDINVDASATEIAGLTSELVISLIGAGVAYAGAYFKTNRAADGTPMTFTRSDGTVVDGSGRPKPRPGALG